ncbi:MAG: hypothetical protein IPG08_17840 [Sphingobacteriaceae bacterium]|nr:hypothetical protein [Sphingobacteriaceae bacterium]
MLWARQSSIVASCRAVCIATDAFNNVYMVGDYRGGMALDTVGLTSYPNNNTDKSLLQFDPNGQSKRVGIIPIAFGLTILNVFVTGDFIGSYVNFGSITLLNPDPVNKTGSTFLAKYNTNGNILWAKNTTGNSVGSNGCWPSALATDASGNVYLTGQFNTSTVGFSSSVSLIKTGLTDVFLTKYNSSGTPYGQGNRTVITIKLQRVLQFVLMETF